LIKNGTAVYNYIFKTLQAVFVLPTSFTGVFVCDLFLVTKIVSNHIVKYSATSQNLGDSVVVDQ